MKKIFLTFSAIFTLCIFVMLTTVMQPFAGLFGVVGAPSANTPVVVVNTQALRAHVKYLSVDAYPRAYSHPDKLEQAARYIEQQLAAVGAKPFNQAVTANGKPYRNIIARFGPATEEVIVIGAHYDSHCHEKPCTPGADDNASGVAGLIELARLLVKTPPKNAVELVAYTLEEPEYFRSDDMGSAWHARSLLDSKRSVKLMVSMEMIGFFSQLPASQYYPVPGMSLLYPDAGNYIGVVGKLSHFGNSRRVKALMSQASSLPAYSINAPTWISGIDFSDHLSYWDLGMPAVMVTDTAFMRNQQYHLAGDTYDKLDYARMAQVVQGVYRVAQHF